MKAHVRRKQRNRRITILVTGAIIAVSLVVAFYVALSLGSSSRDKQVGQAVSASELASLYQLSKTPYGPSGSSQYVNTLRNATGSLYVMHTSPPKLIVVYIGGDFCPFCAIERWSIILALDRFGNFTSLHYMTSAPGEGDYSTFTFKGSSYQSNLISFQAFEQLDRGRAAQETVPQNYSAEFPGSYPFLNVGNKYLLEGSLIAAPDLLGTKNWTQIYSSIANQDQLGAQIKMGANAITALICKAAVSANVALPDSVCAQPPIQTMVFSISAPTAVGDSVLSSTPLNVNQPARRVR